MKIIDKIVQQHTPPQGNVLWYDGENLKIKRNGVFENVGGSGGTDSMIEVTYYELVKMRDEGELLAGQMYRMIDYETYCGWGNTQCAGHPFDLILTALDEKTLDEKCSAIWSERDTDGYFASSNLPAWDVRYCLDNAIGRFTHAAVGGKGVIYRLVDDKNNSVGYDFKNIMFIVSDYSTKIYYTFFEFLDSYTSRDASVFGQVKSNYIADDCVRCFIELSSHNNIGYNCSDITIRTDSNYNSVCSNSKSITIGKYSNYNRIGINNSTITIGDNCVSNYIENDCYNCDIQNNSSYNVIKHGCKSIYAGRYAVGNTFGKYCNNVRLAEQRSYTSGEETNYYYSTGSYFKYNKIGDKVTNVNLYDSQTSSYNYCIQNYSIASNISNVNIEGSRNLPYESMVAITSNGELKVFNLADI